MNKSQNSVNICGKCSLNAVFFSFLRNILLTLLFFLFTKYPRDVSFFPVPVLILHLGNNTISSSIGIGTFSLTPSTCNGLKYLSRCFHWLANCAALSKGFVNRTWSLVGFSFLIKLFVRHCHLGKSCEVSRTSAYDFLKFTVTKKIDGRIFFCYLNTQYLNTHYFHTTV